MKNLGMQEYENVITDPIFGNDETCRIWRRPVIPRSHQNLERTTKWREVLQVPQWPISDDERVHDCQCLCQNRFRESHKEQENNNERIKYKMHHRETGLCSFVAGMKQLAYSQEKKFAKSLWNVDWVQGPRCVLFLLCANTKVVWPERRPEVITCPESLQACNEWNICSKSTALCTCELHWCPTPNSESRSLLCSKV